MSTVEDFKKAYFLFVKEAALKPNSLWVKNEDIGTDYLVKEVSKDSVIIKQGNTPQTHMVEHLKELFITGKLRAPRINNHTYSLNSTEGHLPMKIAIVHHLKKLLRNSPH